MDCPYLDFSWLTCSFMKDDYSASGVLLWLCVLENVRAAMAALGFVRYVPSVISSAVPLKNP